MPAGPAPTITVGFEVLVHEVIAAIATEPVADRGPLPADLDLDRPVGAPVDRGRVGDDRLGRRRGLGAGVGGREGRRVRRRERLAGRLLDLGLAGRPAPRGRRGSSSGSSRAATAAGPGPAAGAGRRPTARRSRGRG